MRYLLLLLLILGSSTLHARTVGGVDLPDKQQVEAQSLVLNGAGIRSKYFMDVYVAGLYLTAPNENAKAILQANAPQSVRLVITSSHITHERLLDSIEEGVRQSAGKDFPRYQDMLQQMLDSLAIEIKVGDQFDFTYRPDSGTQVYRNGTLMSVIKSLEFKQVLYGIWLGDDPVQSSLKRAMLSQ